MEFLVLGPLEARHDGKELPLGSRKQRAVLAILLLRANEVVSRDVLVDDLWGERPPASAEHTLQAYVSRIRKALRAAGVVDDVLLTHPGGYLLRVELEELDLHRFQRLVEEGRRALAVGSPDRAAKKLREALSLWRGHALADLAFEPFARVDVERLEEQRLGAIEDRVEADLALGVRAELIAELETLVVQHPLRERLRAQLMLALYRSGRQAEALHAYRDAREYLVEELGLEPSKELQALERSILSQDDSLELEAEEPVSSAVLTRTAPAGPDGEGDGFIPSGEESPAAEASDGERDIGRPRRRLLVGAAAALVFGLAAGAVAFRAVGHKDGLRRSDVHANAVAFVDARSGAILAQEDVGGPPGGIAAGEGAVWVTSPTASEVLKLDPLTRRVEDRVPVGSEPTAIAAGGGSVWVVNTESRTVSEISPSADTVVATLDVGNGPTAIAYGERGVWVADAVDGTVTRIDPQSARVGRAIRVGQPLDGIAVGLGSVWTTSADRGLLVRIDPETKEVTQTISVGNGPTSIAFAGGVVWVSNPPDGTLSRIDPTIGSVRKTNVFDPGAIASASGQLWVAEPRRLDLVRLDPRARSVVGTVSIGSSPTALAPLGRTLALVTLASPAAHRGGTLRLVAETGLDSIDPGASWSAMGWQLLSLTNDGLVTFARAAGPAGARIVPDLATSLPTPRDGGRTYTFQLRPRLHYSNGAAVRPEDFRAALEREYAASKGLAALGVPLVGAKRCARLPAHCDLSRGVSVDSANRTITFHLSARDPAFLYKLALPFGSVVPADSPPIDIGKRPLPATGPYRIDRYFPGREVVLTRNPQFRARSAARPDGFPDRLRLRLGLDPRRQTAAVRSGAADVMLDSPLPAKLRELARRYPLQAHSYALPEVFAMFVNTRVPPFDHPAARRALNFAVDRAAVVRLAGGRRLADVSCQILPRGFPGYRPFCPYTARPNAAGDWRAADLGRARRLIAASGTAGTAVTVSAPAHDDLKMSTARYFVRLLNRLGYPTRLRIYPGLHPYYARVALVRGDAQIGVFGWRADFEAGSAFFQPLFTCAASTAARFCDRRIDAEIERATGLEAVNPTLANAEWQRVDREVTARAPWVPLVNSRAVDFVGRRVGNYQRNPAFGILLDQLWVR